jgi:hypothetical protein
VSQAEIRCIGLATKRAREQAIAAFVARREIGRDLITLNLDLAGALLSEHHHAERIACALRGDGASSSDQLDTQLRALLAARERIVEALSAESRGTVTG